MFSFDFKQKSTCAFDRLKPRYTCDIKFPKFKNKNHQGNTQMFQVEIQIFKQDVSKIYRYQAKNKDGQNFKTFIFCLIMVLTLE